MDKVQVKYEELEQIAARLAEWASRTADAAQKVNQQHQVLAGGGWIGRGFEKFDDEIQSLMAPAMAKLQDVLENLGNAVRQSGERMKQAEQEAGNRFRS